jgi:hypothetical protein
LTVKRQKEELRKYKNNGIGDMKIETMATLKFIGPEYFINVTDMPQLALITNTIGYQRKRPMP